jgi:hypothetical protein
MYLFIIFLSKVAKLWLLVAHGAYCSPRRRLKPKPDSLLEFTPCVEERCDGGSDPLPGSARLDPTALVDAL